jgi:hypothetical protein
LADCPSISLWDKGNKDSVSMRPASESATVGKVMRFARMVLKFVHLFKENEQITKRQKDQMTKGPDH